MTTDGHSSGIAPPPSDDDQNAWSVYWTACGQPWRTQPEIELERQQQLKACRAIVPNPQTRTYPFANLTPPLSRADVEWLLATHENGRGPINWADERQRQRTGLDLRGADLRKQDLSGLPLARLQGSLGMEYPFDLLTGKPRGGDIHLEGAILEQTHLEGAILRNVYLTGANLSGAFLEQSDLVWAYLEGVRCYGTHLERANLAEAHLEAVHFVSTHLEGATFERAHLEGAGCYRARFEEAVLREAHLGGKKMPGDHLHRVQQWVPSFPEVLQAADLRGAIFGSATDLDRVELGDQQYGFVSLADVVFNGVNLAVIDWTQITRLGDERAISIKTLPGGSNKSSDRQTKELEDAARANRHLATALQQQALNEAAARFDYRAEVMHRKVLWRKRKVLPWLISWCLWVLVGYGYRTVRAIVSYLTIHVLFGALYWLMAGVPWHEAFFVSMSAFHGRGFQPDLYQPGQAGTYISGCEAFVGLVFEAVLIATLTRRFFGR